jgi:hypothetical protein
MNPCETLYTAANGQLADGFAGLLQPISIRVPLQDFRNWCQALRHLPGYFQGLAPAEQKDERTKFARAVNQALKQVRLVPNRDLSARAVGLITGLVTAEATQTIVDDGVLGHFARKTFEGDRLAAVADVIHALYDLFPEKALPPSSDPAAFYYIATAALQVSGFPEYTGLRPPVRFYLAMLRSEEDGVRVLLDVPYDPLQLPNAPEDLTVLVTRLDDGIKAVDVRLNELRERLAVWAARRREMAASVDDLRSDVRRLPGDVTQITPELERQITGLEDQARGLHDRLAKLLGELRDSPRLIPNVRYLQIRMQETLGSLRGKRQRVAARRREIAGEPLAGPDGSPVADASGQPRWQRRLIWWFSGTPVSMTMRGWWSALGLVGGVLLAVVGILLIAAHLAQPTRVRTTEKSAASTMPPCGPLQWPNTIWS